MNFNPARTIHHINLLKEKHMKKLTLLTTTALVAGYMAFAAPAQAAEQGWFDSMKQSVKSWFADEPAQPTAEVDAYLEEVTIAVPPMTGEEAASIQPAAGDYVEDTESVAPAAVNAPGSMDYQVEDETSFNTQIDGTQNSSVTAFGDTPTADDLAGIETAAGDAEEVNDESVVVAGDAEEINDEAVVVVDAEAEADTEAAADAGVSATTDATVDATAGAVEGATETTTDAVEGTVDAVEDVTTDTEVKVETNTESTTGLNTGDVGADAAVTNDTVIGIE